MATPLKKPVDLPVDPAVLDALAALRGAAEAVLRLLAVGEPPRIARPQEAADVTRLCHRLIAPVRACEAALVLCVELWRDQQQRPATGPT